MNRNDKIYVAGHNGLVGSAIVRKLNSIGFNNLILRKHDELDLTKQEQVKELFKKEKPDFVILAAAKVGGIHANNTYPAEFIYENIMIEANVINAAYENKVKKLLFLGSSCIYPASVEQPMKESALLRGILEPTNEPYAIAKIAGIKLCESYNRQYNTDFRSVMPTNLYGAYDNFHPENSHVIPGLIRRFHKAKIDNDPSVEVWGSGRAMREFLYVDDMADACLFVLGLDKDIFKSNTRPMLSHINIGTGKDISIKELANIIKQIVGFEGKVIFDYEKPDGPTRKLLDVSCLTNMGWQHKVDLREGLKLTYSHFLENSL